MKSSRTSTKTPFCKICFNAKKTKQDYTSHSIKDYSSNSSGVTVCPTILNTKCSYCHNKGHWKSECPKLKKNKTIPKLDIPKPKLVKNVYFNQEDLGEIYPLIEKNKVDTNKYNILAQENCNETPNMYVPLHKPITPTKILNWADCDSDTDYD